MHKASLPLPLYLRFSRPCLSYRDSSVESVTLRVEELARPRRAGQSIPFAAKHGLLRRTRFWTTVKLLPRCMASPVPARLLSVLMEGGFLSSALFGARLGSHMWTLDQKTLLSLYKVRLLNDLDCPAQSKRLTYRLRWLGFLN